MTLDCVVFNKNELYLPISLIGKLSSYYDLLSKTKFNLEDLYLRVDMVGTNHNKVLTQ